MQNIVKETHNIFSLMGPGFIETASNDLLLGMDLLGKKSFLAENTNSKIDNEIINISKVSFKNAINILQNRFLLDKLLINF